MLFVLGNTEHDLHVCTMGAGTAVGLQGAAQRITERFRVGIAKGVDRPPPLIDRVSWGGCFGLKLV